MRAMTVRSMWVFWLVGWLMAAVPGAVASAADLDAALAAYRQGDFARAAELARATGSAQGFALAARAELAHSDLIVVPGERGDGLERAERWARRAIELDPSVDEGHLQLAVALGMIGRERGVVPAHFDGYADEARAHLDLVLARKPGSAWANALLGGWHLEIVYGGGMVGEILYDADAAEGVARYRRALAIGPDNDLIAFQFALQLLAVYRDDPEFTDEARRLLNRLLDKTPQDAVERLTRDRAARLLSALDAGGPGDVEAMTRRLLGAPLVAAGKEGRRIEIRPPIGSRK